MLNFVGGSIRWLWGQIRFYLFGGKKYLFREYFNGPEDSDDEIVDRMGHTLINRVLGLIVVMLLAFLSVKYWA